ncbi:MAG: FG-GAP-like repeat-containing protein [Proteobacteria bacterium]|nr:FG-GAP-like repeat-containing protein [Pseudomonadota bacterium]
MSKKPLVTFLVLIIVLFMPCRPARAGELRLAIFPFSVHTQDDISYIRDGITSLLPSRIAVSNRLSVIDSFLVRSELGKLPAEHPLSADVALGRKLKVDYILIGSITKIGANVSLDTRLVNTAAADDVTPFFIQSIGLNDMLPQLTAYGETIRNKILGKTETARPVMAPSPQSEPSSPAPTAQHPDAEPEATENTEYQTVMQPRGEKKPPLFEANSFYSIDIPGESFHCITSGDLAGDGKKELLVLSEYKVLVYQWIDGGLKLKDEIKAGVKEHLIHIDTGDTNRNGRDEIFVSSVGENTPNFFAPNSFVLEMQDNTYNKIEKAQQWVFRTYQPPGKRTVILGQTAGENNPFANQIFSFSWKNGNLLMRNEFLIPESLNLYSFVEGDINNDGRLEYLAFYKGLLSFNYQLCIFTSLGRMIWRDQQLKLGGEVNNYSKLIFNNDTREKEFLPMRIMCDDYNGDGKLDVIVARNSIKGSVITKKLSRYNQGEVLCLHWDGYELAPNWSSGMLDGYVTDYGVFDFDGDGQKELFILSVAEAGILSKVKTRLTVFKQASAGH